MRLFTAAFGFLPGLQYRSLHISLRLHEVGVRIMPGLAGSVAA
jgi:hypothetical protein